MLSDRSIPDLLGVILPSQRVESRGGLCVETVPDLEKIEQEPSLAGPLSDFVGATRQ